VRSAFPLQWPEGWTRTKYSSRTYPKFVSSLVEDRDAIIRRLQRRGGANIVITSQLPLNTKGLPYAGPVEDPGIAVYWFEGKIDKARTERVLACDRWIRVSDNMRAIAKSLAALDGIDRWGASQVVERAFAGFAALPPGSSGTIATPTHRPWREVLGGEWPALERADTLAIAKSRHRKAIAEAHPDRGGDPARAAELNAAMAEAEAELGSAP